MINEISHLPYRCKELTDHLPTFTIVFAIIEWPLGWLDPLKTQFSILQTNIFSNSLDWRNRFGRYWKNSAVEVLPTANWLFWPSYSAGQKKCYNYCFMKQKCQLQEGTARYRNVTTLLSSKGIDTTHQHFQMRYATLFQLQGLKSYHLK